MGDPVGAARHVREALAPDGTWMIVEPYAGDTVADNLNPVGRAYYGFSHLPVRAERAVPGRAGTRSARRPGRPAIRQVVADAGFTRVRRAAETPFNIVLEARP